MRTRRLYANFFEYLANATQSPFQLSLDKLKLKNDRWRHILSSPFHGTENLLTRWADEATKMGRALETMARLETTKTFDKLIQASLEYGGGWIHKYLKNEKQQTATICSDLIVRGLPTHTDGSVRQIFKDCGDIARIELGKEGNNTAAVHFRDDDCRNNALLLNITLLPDGTTITVEGVKRRYTTDPMDILEAHSNTWGKQWKAGDPS